MSKRQELLVILALFICTVLLAYVTVAARHEMRSKISPATQQGQVRKDILPTLSSYSKGQKDSVIRTINLVLSADDSKMVYQQLVNITAQNHGVITHENMSGIKDTNYSGSMLLVIPADNISAALNQMNQLNAVVMSEQTNSQDMSSNRKSLQAQLESAQDLGAKYLAVLKTTQSIADITNITNHLTDERRNIDAITQQIKQLNNSMSSISINVQLNQTPVIVVPDNSWKATAIVMSAASSLKATLQALLTVVIWLSVYVIPLLLIYFVLHFIFRVLGFQK